MYDENFERLKQNYAKYIQALGKSLKDAGVENLGDVTILCIKDSLNKRYVVDSTTEEIKEDPSWDSRSIQEYGKILTTGGLHQEIKCAKTPPVIEELLQNAARLGLTAELQEPIAAISNFVKTEIVENEFKVNQAKELQSKKEAEKTLPESEPQDFISEQIQGILDIFMIFMPEQYNELAAQQEQRRPSFAEKLRTKSNQPMLVR